MPRPGPWHGRLSHYDPWSTEINSRGSSAGGEAHPDAPGLPECPGRVEEICFSGQGYDHTRNATG